MTGEEKPKRISVEPSSETNVPWQPLNPELRDTFESRHFRPKALIPSEAPPLSSADINRIAAEKAARDAEEAEDEARKRLHQWGVAAIRSGFTLPKEAYFESVAAELRRGLEEEQEKQNPPIKEKPKTGLIKRILGASAAAFALGNAPAAPVAPYVPTIPHYGPASAGGDAEAAQMPAQAARMTPQEEAALTSQQEVVDDTAFAPEVRSTESAAAEAQPQAVEAHERRYDNVAHIERGSGAERALAHLLDTANPEWRNALLARFNITYGRGGGTEAAKKLVVDLGFLSEAREDARLRQERDEPLSSEDLELLQHSPDPTVSGMFVLEEGGMLTLHPTHGQQLELFDGGGLEGRYLNFRTGIRY